MDIVRGVLNVCSLITIVFVFYTIIEYIKHMIKIIKNRRFRDLFTLEPVKEGLRSLEIKNEWAAKVFIIALIIGGLYGILSLTVKVESIGHFFEKRKVSTRLGSGIYFTVQHVGIKTGTRKNLGPINHPNFLTT